MRIHLLYALGTLLLLTGIVPSQAELSYHVGLRALAAKVPEHGKAIELTLWTLRNRSGPTR